MPPRPQREDATSHDDLLMAIGEMRGEMKANFTTLFVQHRAMGQKLDGACDDICELKTRASIAPAPAPVLAAVPAKLKPWQWASVGAALIAVLGGLSSAYERIEAIAIALRHALIGGHP